MPACPFCPPDPGRVFHEGELTLVLWDAFPVSPGHALIVTRRHVASWFEATAAEQAELLLAIAHARQTIEAHHRPAGYNIGVNVGDAAGQTVLHLHLHVIPRFAGDVEDPRGGVRHVIPERANYLRTHHEDRVSEATDFRFELADSPLVRGEADPLLPHLRDHFAKADAVNVAVAFVQRSGLDAIRDSLYDLVDRGGRLRLLTGDYLGITDPDALRWLLDLQVIVGSQRSASVDLRVFETKGLSFHPKSYLFRFPDGGIAYVGSSNLTRSALTEAVEWNYRVVLARDRHGFGAVSAAFEAMFRDSRTVPLTIEWVEDYRKRRPTGHAAPEMLVEPDAMPPTPHRTQIEALEALARTRDRGERAGLVVMATGLGKTWLAAFDFEQAGATRGLFVAHREEILRQAMSTFRRMRPRALLGFYTGEQKTADADVIFASVQTLGRSDQLRRFPPNAFDYIVIDEFHHASARTYRNIIDHFEPRFLLGLTATPDRTDGGDLLALCGENLVFRCDLFDAIRAAPDRIVPFHYFGVPDDVDYANIPWRRSGFDPDALTIAVTTRTRAANALQQWRRHAGPGHRTLAFCCSQRHADFMTEFFREAGVRAVAVHSGPLSAARANSMDALAAGELEVVFAVDIFNEGVDVPTVDTVLMLRPTESKVLWLQQLGRGLRYAAGKTHLTVVDYIGNHRSFLLKPQALLALTPGDSLLHRALELLATRDFAALGLPAGCEVTYELEAIDILRRLLRAPTAGEALSTWYEDTRAATGIRPTALEAFHECLSPRTAAPTHGSWLRFVDFMGDLDDDQRAVLADVGAGTFLAELENTAMTKSFKMITLLVMLHSDALPGRIVITELAKGFVRLVRRNARLQAEVLADLDDDGAVRRYLEDNPIAAWCRPKGRGGRVFFRYADGFLETTFTVEDSRRETFQTLAREIVDWRLAAHLRRTTEIVSGVARLVCKVLQTGGRPILKLPNRKRHQDIPREWIAITIDGVPHEAKFAKEYVNVIRENRGEANKLPEIVRGWFGEHAGQPGTEFHVVFTHDGDTWMLAPHTAAAD